MNRPATTLQRLMRQTSRFVFIRVHSWFSALRLLCLFVASLVCLCAFSPFNASAQQDLDDSWTVTVNGQVVPVRADGTFRIPNISAPDFLPYGFTPSGNFLPGDFIGDDFVRVIAHSNKGGTYSITNLFFSDIPPRRPEAIGVVPDTATLTSLGQTTQVRVTARYADGGTYDVSPRSRYTSYRVSNPAIATLDDDGVLTARAKGMVYVTAMNEGVAGVTQVDISPGDPLTTLTGVIQTSNGVPASGAVITIPGQAGKFAVTRADGSFVLTNVATGFGPPDLLVEFSDGVNCYKADVRQVALMPGAISDAGLIAVQVIVNPPGLLAWWPGDGSAEDLLLGNNGTLKNGAAFTNGIVGQAFDFDGVDDYVQIPGAIIDVRQAYTLEAWVNLRTDHGGVGAVQDILQKNTAVAGTTPDLGFFVTPARKLGIHQVGGSVPGGVFSAGQIPLNVWTHVAVTYDGAGTNRFYINGQLDSLAAQTSGMNAATGWLMGGQNRFNGGIDEPAIYNRALSLAEIQGIYAAGDLGLCKSFPPRALALGPTNNAIVGTLSGVSVTFNRSLAPASLTPSTFTLTAAGPDLRLDTPDDQLLTTGQLTYNDALKTAFLNFTNGLPPGLYRATIGSNILSLTGKPLENPTTWTFWVLPGGPAGDDDFDGLSNTNEIARGLNPLRLDTDGDGWDDATELADGTDPLDRSSGPRFAVSSPQVSYFNGLLTGLPASLSASVASPTVSYFNGLVEVLPPGLPVSLASPSVSYFNGLFSPGPTNLFLVSPVVSYEKQ